MTVTLNHVRAGHTDQPMRLMSADSHAGKDTRQTPSGSCPPARPTTPLRPTRGQHLPANLHQRGIFEHMSRSSRPLPDSDQILAAKLTGTAACHAQRRDLAPDEHTTGVTELRDPAPAAGIDPWRVRRRRCVGESMSGI